MTPLLSVRNLVTTFRTDRGLVRAVDGVSFDVQSGETLGLVGESGCGKSVTALSILRLVPNPPGAYDGGSQVIFEDRDLFTLPKKELRKVRGAKIAMVFQEPTTSLNPVLTVGSQIRETILAHEKVTKKSAHLRSVELLELVGIPDPSRRVHDYAHQMSGGMQQRVMIAMALACRPKLLIADEPTTALDVTVQAQILDLLADLKDRFGMAVIFITHDLAVVAQIADRVAVMYGGRIVEEGLTAQIFENPKHPYTQGLLRAVPRVDEVQATLTGIPGAVPQASDWPTGCRFHPRCAQRLERCSADVPPAFHADRHHDAACWLLDETRV